MSSDSAPGAGTAPAPRKRAAKPAARVSAAKESRGEEILHELFRLCGVDLRANAHGKKLASEFASLIKKGA